MRRSLGPAVALLWCLLFPGIGLAQGSAPIISPKVSPDLLSLSREYGMPLTAQPAGPLAASLATLPVAQDYVTVDAAASDDPGALLGDLAALGLVNGASHGRIVSGLLPISAIPALESLGTLQFVRPAYAATNVGLVTCQGDQAQRSDLARSMFGLDGTSVTVGVLSDSFNCLGGAAGNVASGDLSPVNVLQEISSCPGAIDEGRAMLQIVHDVAPGAGLAFASAFNGMASFANNINALRLAGANVIVDDVFYFAEPMFQDGIIAQAVDQVVAAGVPYFSSAGNQAREAYDSPFRNGGLFAAGSFGSASFLGGTAHDFDPGSGTDVFQSITFPATGTYGMSLQWDSPFFSVSGAPGSLNDLNVYFLDSANTTVLVPINTDNTAGGAGGDPVEVISLNVNTAPLTVSLMIVNRTGTNPGRLKHTWFRNVNINEFATNSGTISGHPNAVGAEAVGAAFYANTPAFGVTPPLLESFSSAGTTPILFTTTGAPTFDARADKPEIVAPDGANTTFFFAGVNPDGDGFPNFFGTSAAAPHAAAVAALMLQAIPTLSPAQVYQALESTALDMGAAGFDNDSGFGLIRADAALSSLHSLSITSGPSGAPNPVASAGPVNVSVSATDSLGHALTYAWTATCPTLGGNGSFDDATLPNPVWTAPANTTGSQQSCTLSVTVSDGQGLSQSASYGQGVQTAGDPTLTLRLNQTSFHAGDTMILTLTLTPGVVPRLVDAYVVIRVPDGHLFSILLSGAVPGIAPIATGFTPIAIEGELFRYTFTGSEPPGPYSWFTALVATATGAVIGTIDEDDFEVSR